MNTTLLSLTSKQIWPQVLAVAHLKPDRVILLHSENSAESKGPAQRLRHFFDNSTLVPKGDTRLEVVPDTDFDAIERRLDEIQLHHKLPLSNCILNFTGGNKLMATAAFRWCARRGIRAFYLERRNQLTWFEPRDGEIRTRTAQIDGHKTDDLDAVDLLVCQLGSATVKMRGENLKLNQEGRNGDVEAVQAHLKQVHQASDSNMDFRKWLDISSTGRIETREGDDLEYAVAAILLKLGVPCVCRSIEIKPGENTPFVEGELDLVFNWAGRLWVVDCKDKASNKLKLSNLKRAMEKESPISAAVQKQLAVIERDLGEKDIKVLREDLQQISEAGGLLGNAIAVRSAGLPLQAVEYARSRRPQVEVIYKNELVPRMRALLRADSPASSGDLIALAGFMKGRM